LFDCGRDEGEVEREKENDDDLTELRFELGAGHSGVAGGIT
jgi:hypothetical protein